ncbi:Down syndrome cell adhesion molecule-like protein Dscam2 isoform X4 [Apis mellifera]|uniref:Down syndrome cell adhesion molecule-like protein Dscam2 isoform X4 n=1 Tax=Apis mellifera TaxID=7460 RepID=A0A7M7MWR5_APIME|nr:Down syndrome cell adhesion molecule-like protein Dscam2 isoform X4 [Apis mellifera]|eukprot:XP_026302203.1 Down syndrome cell adhesion molecule-like protein Dscam2 isoform X4 [Apis mellifera]
MASWPLRIVLLSSTLILVRGRGVVLDSQGPVLISEPRSSVEFSNETGAMIHCSAQGSPLPRIDWLMGDESPVLPIPHIREMLVNGSMYFLPFGAETYRHDVHSAVYRCQASNSVGRVLGREITVKADDRHHMLPTGELLVFSVTSSDAQSSYRCRTVHRVTGDTVESSSYARLVVTDPHTPVPPRFNERVSPAPIRTGETIVLSCISQGIPPPMYLWFRESVTGTAMIFNSERIYARAGVLVLQSARAEDAGRYVCHANNTAGSEMVELEVSIISSLSIHLVPQQVTVDLGKDAEFQCSVTGQPIPVIFWTKDGLPVGESASGRSKITGNDGSTLRISSVVRDDKGMYQCFAKNDYEMVQATAELRLGDAAPQLLYKFIEQTIQPGPSVSLKCIATGNPTPHFSWTLDGFPLPQNDRFMIGQYVTVHGDVISHVNISVVHVEDGGEYRCTAANRMAKVHHSARLNIYGLPHVRPMGNYAAVAGETTVIKCPVAGFPIASITWEKDGKVLPTSRRQEVFPNGTLVLHHVDRSTDHGAYTCTAKNKQGRSDSQTVHIEVKVPPTIAPFSFNKDLSEGVRAQVTCMVEKGDPPFTIAWSKDGEAIAGPSPAAAGFGNTGITGPRHTQTPAGLRVTNIDAHSSTIVIERVSAAHSGNYTCMARNSVAEVLWTAELIVRVPPRWVMEPQDVRASEGMSRLVLHCHADGFPPPAVSWRRASGKKPGNYRDIVTHEHAQNLRIHSNGSLVFGRVQEDHEGFYLCEAVNGIGAGLSKVVHLTVNVPAHFAEKHRNQTARLGSSASLRCEAKGDHPLKILWKKMGAHLEQKLSDYRYTLKEENTTDGIISTLEFISTSREDSARYFCIASNAYGRDEMTIHLYIQEPPDFPRNLHVIEKGSRYINISWTTSQDGNSPITQYIIEYKTDTEVWHDHTFHMTVPGSQAHAHVSGLRPAVSYQFRIYAENELGRSQASDILETTTEGEKPGGPPRNLKVDPVSSTEFNVTWDPPDHDLWNGEILGYHIGYKEHRLGSDQYTYRTVERRISTASVALGLARMSMPGTQYQLTNLKKFTRYSVVVQAYNVLGQGPMTPEVVATTLEDVPSSPPQDIRCTALTSQSLQVSWDAPPDSSLNGILKSYKVIWENMNVLTESPKSETKITSALTVVIHGLEKYTNYSVQVLASTRAGDGIASSSLYCVTEEDLPEVPAGVKAVVRSATSIIVSWQPPLRSNGNITSYNVHIRWVNPEGKWYKRSLPPYQTSYQVENLHKKNQYEFSIAAVTSVGEGPQTQLVTVSLSSEVRAAIYSFGTVLVVPWKQNVTLPCQSVGNPEPSVIWKQWGQIVKSSSRVSLLSEGSLQIMDLHREDSGNYTCYVKNRHGSDQITHRLTVQVPPAAPLLHATSATSNSINVQWKNRDDGGAPIRGYILHYKRESGEWEEMKVSHKINSFVLSRLWCGNDYQMYLTAYNRIGMGSPSEIVKATTNGSKPENSPSNGDKFVTVNVSWITLHLSMWNDGGCPITHFELEYRKNGEDIWTLVSNNIEVQKTYTLSELQPGTTYDIRTRAHNNAGFSVAEYRITTLQPHVSSTVASVEIDQYIPQHTSVYSDLKLIIPLILSSLAIIAAAGAVFYCFRKRPFIGEMASLHDAQTAAALDNKQNMEQREQYYATVRKPLRSPIHEMGTLEKIPEYSEDIYPYATFQLEESVPPGGDSRCNSAAPLQTFVYHDPRLSTADTLQLRESDCNRYTKVRGGRSSSAPLHKTHKVSQGKSESEEYDTLGSDSDTEVGTSSRTESSNHLVDSHHSVSAADSRVHNFLYHGPESSTSTEPSPIFERKSFPGRGRSKMLQLARHTSEETRSNFGPISGFGNPKHQSSNSCSNRDQERDGSGNLFVPKLDPPSGFSDAFELSEAECDLDRGHTSQRNVRDFVIAV